MTKAEIIRKLAKRAGITDLDAKVFFEAFLRKAISRLNPGDSIKVKGFGYFQRRTGKVKNHIDSNINKALADLIVFYPFRNENEEENENLIFDVPARMEQEYNLIDSYFSISFGKPVIPLKDANPSEFYIPPVGNELIRLIDIRAEKLLDETEVVENYIKGNELLLIDSGVINPNQMEINWEENDISRGSTGEIFSVKDDLEASDKITWDFGEDLEKQIQEESILDTGSEDKLFVDYDDLKGLSWEFGINGEKEKVEESSADNEKEPFIPIVSNDETKEEYEKPEINEPEDREPEETSEPETEEQVQPGEQEELEPDSFQRVNSFTKEYKIDQNKFGLTKSEMDLSWTFGQEDSDEDSALLKSITQEMNDDGFAEIKHTRRKYNFETDVSEPKDEEPDYKSEGIFISEPEPETETGAEKEFEEYEEQLYVRPIERVTVPEPEEKLNKVIDSYPQIADRTPGYTQKKGLGIFVITSLVLVLCGAVLLYVKMSNLISPIPTVQKTLPATSNVSSVTIERDFEIPVTYPYIRDNSVKAAVDPFSGSLSAPIDLKESKPSEEMQTPEETKQVGKETPKIGTKDVKAGLKPVKLKEFIYQSGDKYLVQVSSWPSEPSALKHASYFKNKGFDTQIEKAYLGKGYWYRVRVGYFKSESEAESFYKKYK